MSWVLLGIASAVFASLVAIFGKLGLKNIDPTIGTTIRSIIMAGFLIITTFALQKWNTFHGLATRDWVLITLSGIAGALSWLAYFWALKIGNASAVSALDRLSIVFVVILAGIFLGEGFSWKGIVGSILVAGGVLLITWK